jgi:hypothetical protein
MGALAEPEAATPGVLGALRLLLVFLVSTSRPEHFVTVLSSFTTQKKKKNTCLEEEL